MRVLYVVCCGAPPVGQLPEAVAGLRVAGWDVWVMATPAALGFMDRARVEEVSGHPVRCEPRAPGEPSLAMPTADAVAVAPLTFNTLAKWSMGLADNTAVGVLQEVAFSGVPVVAGVWAKEGLRAHPRFAEHVGVLAGAGVVFLPPGSGYGGFDWAALAAALPRASGS